MVRLLYFASLKESLGESAEDVEIHEAISDVEGLRRWICQRGEPWQSVMGEDQRLMAAVNQELARPETPVSDGDEVAFFPPVTGG